LVQITAASQTSPFEATIALLARLRLQKPKESMDETEMGRFFKDVAAQLEEKGYCYYAINQGIKDIINKETDVWFPQMYTLNKYIAPIDYKVKQRRRKLEEMLLRKHKEIE
jgi:hypothetical protein